MAEAVPGRLQEYTEYSAKAPWKLTVEPFRVAPRVYYVGNEWVGAFLIDTEEGLILLDTCVFENVYLTLDAIYKLGFDPRDIKHIMLTHCHVDHTGGAKAIQELTKAKVWMSGADAEFRSHPASVIMSEVFHDAPYDVDCFYDDSKSMQFGQVKIQTCLTPGHTPGTTTFFISSLGDDGKMLTMGLHGGVGLLTMADEYYRTHNLPNLRPRFISDCERLKECRVDIAIPSHPAHGDLLERKSRDNKDYGPLVDPKAWPAYLESRIQFAKELERKKG